MKNSITTRRNLVVFLGALWVAVGAQRPSLEAFTLQQGVVPPAQLILNPIAIAAGGAHTCALMSNKSVKCWGANSRGELGDGGPISPNAYRATPTAVAG
jgi:alpha-tubulin suppressor-like RCC1 family protein